MGLPCMSQDEMISPVTVSAVTVYPWIPGSSKKRVTHPPTPSILHPNGCSPHKHEGVNWPVIA